MEKKAFFHLRSLALFAATSLLLGCATAAEVTRISGQIASGFTGDQRFATVAEGTAKTMQLYARSTEDITEEQEYYIGRTVSVYILDQYRFYAGPLSDYISAIGHTLALASDRPQTFKGYHFIVLDAPEEVNAFAAPSGFIFITTGAISRAKNEDEVAGILAHEIAHIVNGDPIQAIKASNLKKIPYVVIKTAAEVQWSREQVEQLERAFGTVVQDILKAALNGYDRGKETEADAVAVRIMAKAGYSPMALAHYLSRLESKGQGIDVLSTHWRPQKRASSVRRSISLMDEIPTILPERTARFEQEIRARR